MISRSSRRYEIWRFVALLGILTCCLTSWAQIRKTVTQSDTKPAQPIEPAQDPLGRTTPRGAVLGFLAAAYGRDYDTAAQYLNTRQREKDAAEQAKELFFVLDRRLPAKLNNLSNDPQGSLSDPFDSRREFVGSVASEDGKVDIYVERIDRAGGAPIWLFSRQTLALIPDLYQEINAVLVENVLPEYLLQRFLGLSLFGWAFFIIGIPLFYLSLGLVGKLLSILAGYVLRRLKKDQQIANPRVFPHPVRLLITACVIRWTYSRVSLPLLARQVGNMTIALLVVLALVWLLILLNGRCETYFKRRMEKRGRLASTAILRPLRRTADFFAVMVGLIIALHSFGVNPSAALAGLGVGGIAIALAAQKTLENVIGGASVILDEAVHVGDFCKIGDVVGTVEEIGLRSTRVRTMDRTLVNIPNGQIATMSLENYSARDSFWFRHMIGITYETSPASLNNVLERIRTVLEKDSRVMRGSSRARFLRFAESSLEMEVFAYVRAREWTEYLEIQEDLLLRIREVVTSNGASMAFPSRMIYLQRDHEGELLDMAAKIRTAKAGEP